MVILGLGLTLYSAILLKFYLGIFQEPKKENIKSKLYWLGFIGWQICLNTQLIFFHPGINLVLTLVTTMIVSLGGYRGTVWKKIFITVIFVAVWMLLEGLMEVGFLYLNGGLNPPFIIVIWSSILLTIFVVIVYIMVHHRKNRNRDGKILLILLILLGMVLYVTNYMLVRDVEGYSYSYALLWIVTSVLLLMNMAVYPIHSKLEDIIVIKRNIKMYKRQMNAYKEQFLVEKTTHQELYRVQHDMKQQLLYLRELARQGKKEALMERIEVLLGESVTEQDSTVKTGNLTVDAIINHMHKKMVQGEIRLHTELKVGATIGISDGDLWVLLGNLIDNAIEASECISRENREVWIQILQEKGILYIMIRNRFSGEVQINREKGLVSHKGRKFHGFGICSARKIAEKYNGNLLIKWSGNIFMADAILYENL